MIEPPGPGASRELAEIWRHRAAFIYFVRRFVEKRTGRTFLGYAWFFLPVFVPLFTGALVFGGILGVKVGQVPYFLYFLVASSGWFVFFQATFFGTRSLEIAKNDIRRVYVPRLIPLASAITLPLATMLVYGLLIACSVGFYVVERGEFYLALGATTLLAPCGIVMVMLFALAVALWFSPLAPRARDVRFLATYVLTMWYFLTPVIYPVDQIPAGWRFLASLNPVTAPIELVKEGLLDVGEVTLLGLAVYWGALVVVGGLGLRVFIAKERRDLAHY